MTLKETAGVSRHSDSTVVVRVLLNGVPIPSVQVGLDVIQRTEDSLSFRASNIESRWLLKLIVAGMASAGSNCLSCLTNHHWCFWIFIFKRTSRSAVEVEARQRVWCGCSCHWWYKYQSKWKPLISGYALINNWAQLVFAPLLEGYKHQEDWYMVLITNTLKAILNLVKCWFNSRNVCRCCGYICIQCRCNQAGVAIGLSEAADDFDR